MTCTLGRSADLEAASASRRLPSAQFLKLANGRSKLWKLIGHNLQRSVDLVLAEAFKVTEPEALGFSLVFVLEKGRVGNP